MKRWLLAFVLATLVSPAHAQPAAPAAQTAPAAEAVAIPIGEIGAEAEAAEAWAQEVESELRTGLEERTRALLTRLDVEISQREASLERIPAGPAPGRALSAARAGWEELDGELARTQNELERAGDGLERRLGEARARGARWTLTAAAARGESVPASVLAGVQDVLGRLDGVRDGVEQRRNGILALEQRVLLQRRRVDGALERVVALRGELRSRLLERDQPPLWSLRPVQDVHAELRRTSALLGATGREVRGYAESNPERLLVHLALIGFLIWAAARRGPTLRRASGEAEGAADVLTHPVAAGLLAGLAPVRALNPDAPPAFITLVGVIALGPWLRVL